CLADPDRALHDAGRHRRRRACGRRRRSRAASERLRHEGQRGRRGEAGGARARDARALAQSFQAAWNAHDAQALAGLFAESADYVGSDERTIVGRDEIQKAILHQNSKDATKEATSSVSVLSVRILRPDVAIADWNVLVRGLRSLDGTLSPPQAQRMTVVMTREPGGWVLASVRAGRSRPATPEEIGAMGGGVR
ncbi:MAG TPA: SgcJ/EcaC family oxidoreductase, partial [Thermoanaerobaculia bacterium]|nr:SgcJ/EcaC family oxidoreductase [Thermoanaerobaculia bacterium]